MAPLRSFTSLRRYVGSGDDWRQAVWNRWLVSYLTPREEGSASEPESNGAADGGPSDREPAAGASSVRGSPAGESRVAAADPSESGKEAESSASHEAANLDGEPGGVVRRQVAARARLEAIGEQMYAVEESLDVLSQRLQVRDVSDRRSTQRMMELVERMVEAVERQSEVLERSITTLERVERRLARVDRWVRPAGIESVPPPPSPSGIVGLGGASGARLGLTEDNGSRTPSMSGSLSDMSVATLLSMFELEKRTGWLVIEGEMDRVRFELLEGSVVSGSINDRPEDPLDVLRAALRWGAGSFSFCHVTVTPSDYPLRSVGAMLIEASRQNDEAVRVLD